MVPSCGRRAITDQELADVVSYVQLLQRDTPNPGGFSLSDTGSVAEGLVAWVLGMGLLIVIVRRIGSDD